MSKTAAPPRKAPARPASPLPDQLLAALEGHLPRVRISLGYRLGLLLATLVMLLLPFIYVGLIILVALGVYWHMVHDVGILSVAGHSGRAGLIILFVYLAPLLIGGLLILFMTKPIFAKRAKRPAPLTLSRSDQHLLYAFVDKLCTLVGARKPSRIDVDCQVNASASFHDGLLGFLSGKLVLTIGLPLAGGMTLQELTGVLAHEFGHFAQGTGMRLTYIVRTISAWLARIALERDAWDQWLDELASSNSHWSINVFGWLSKLMVWLTRRILWCLMWVGHSVSSFMLRQMEFDADRYEARVAGSTSFAATSEKIAFLNVAQNAAFNDLSAAWREKRLCDDLTKLVLSRETDMPGEVRRQIRDASAGRNTGWFDTHPCDRDRIASAQRENAEGLFHIEGPARLLFHDFDTLSRVATERFYRENLGPRFSTGHLVTTDSLVEQRGERKKAHSSLQRFFQGLINPIRPVFPERGTYVPPSRDAAAEMLLHARTRLLEAVPDAREAAKAFEAADDALINIARARAALEVGVSPAVLNIGDLGITGPLTHASIGVRARELESQRAHTAAQVTDAIAGAAMIRINIALDFHKQDQAVTRAPDPGTGAYDLTETPTAGSGDRILDALTALRTTAARIDTIRHEYTALGQLLSFCKPQNNPEHLIRNILAAARKLHEQLTQVHAVLRGTPYPYEHAERAASISRYALETLLPPDNVVGVYRAAESTLGAVYSLYMRLMSDLAARAEALETDLGLDPLPDLPENPS